ncbi:MAG: MerR family DNA-binding transcriptional regulator [Propionibacteriaceae bacterium]|nr:MerR family DNA-binding transcriptional regulator [Propionibacteriaceae bacterium]
MTEYTIGEAAQILGVTTRTLRHWDQIGLFPPSFRTWSEHRLYTDDDLDAALRLKR